MLALNAGKIVSRLRLSQFRQSAARLQWLKGRDPLLEGDVFLNEE